MTMFQYGGQQYLTGSGPAGTLGISKQEMGSDFLGYVQNAYKTNGVVFACMLTRMNVFSEARFQWRTYNNGRPGNLFGTRELAPLEIPWENGTTGDLLTKAIVDVDVAGNFYAVRRFDTIRRLRPDWVTIVMGSKNAPEEALSAPQWDAVPLGYLYSDGGPGVSDPIYFSPAEVCHWAPVQDPTAMFRGMSWLTPITDEILGDKAGTAHKLKFFEHGATPNVIVTLDPSIKAEMFLSWVEAMRVGTEGVENAYKTMFLGGGAAAQVVGTNLRQIDFADVTSIGEVRIAAAAGVPPILIGLREGLRAATYSNYVQARRSFADGTLRPLWRSLCASLESILTVPAGAHLWYDDRDIPLLMQDKQDQATIQLTQASVIGSHIASGFTAESAVEATLADDISLLVHTGLTSVQMQEPPPTGQSVSVPAPVQTPPNKPPPSPVEKTGRSQEEATRDALLARLLEARRLALEPGEGR
jgi:hypothetical protein